MRLSVKRIFDLHRKFNNANSTEIQSFLHARQLSVVRMQAGTIERKRSRDGIAKAC